MKRGILKILYLTFLILSLVSCVSINSIAVRAGEAVEKSSPWKPDSSPGKLDSVVDEGDTDEKEIPGMPDRAGEEGKADVKDSAGEDGGSVQGAAPARAVLVLPDHLISAEASGFSMDEEKSKLYFTYSSADQSDLDFLFAMSSCWGLFPSEKFRADGVEDCDIYQMAALDSDYEARVLYSEKEKSIMVYADADAYVPSDDQIRQMRSMLMKDIHVPDNGDGKNALPQFYACVGRDPYWNGRIGTVDHIFEGKTCWTEWYDHIEKVKILDYVYCMILFGYDVHVDGKSGDTTLLHFSNGDAETIVQYNSVNQSANIYYKPGVSYNLLDGDDLAGCLEG